MCNSHSVSPAVPGLITAAISIISDAEITVEWSGSSGVGGDIVRYIVNVREYSSDGPGKVKTSNVASYPQQLPGTQREFTVKILGKTAALVSFLCASVALCSCGLHWALCSCGLHWALYSCGLHWVLYSCGLHWALCSCGLHWALCFCGLHWMLCSCGPHWMLCSCGLRWMLCSVVYTGCCAPLQWARCHMTCNSWPGMYRAVERRSFQHLSSPRRDVGVSACDPRTACGVYCVELSECDVLTHSSAESSSQCDGGETQRHHHERLLHQAEHRGSSGSQRCLHRQILPPDLGRQEAGTVPEYGGA